MRLAILMTNTDESSFAQAHPKDGEKFSKLLNSVRPDWQFEVFSVKDGDFPASLDFDGLLITGSPASVHEEASWIPRLEKLVRTASAARIPMFGACFGHQVIARALGSRVIYNPDGWALGCLQTQFVEEGITVPIYAAHKEQVQDLPAGARVVAQTSNCKIAGFAIDRHILTTQYHPEMTKDFIAALLDAFAPEIGPDVTSRAARTLDIEPDIRFLAEWIARFFENAPLE